MSENTTKDDGGPAFPIPLLQGQSLAVGVSPDGMTLRDYFAAKAIPVFLGGVWGDDTVGEAAKELGIHANEYNPKIHWPILCVRRAYAIADAMIQERAK